MTPEALHMSNTCRWVTPSDVIEAAREVMGSIDLDPASEEAANKIIGAKDYYTEITNGLNPNNKWYGNVWVNPPGDKRGELPKAFWKRLLTEWESGNVRQAMFLIFSLNQLQTLQDVAAPTDYPFLIFRKHLKFINPDTMQAANQPAQGNALIYLPSLDIPTSKIQLRKFIQVFSKFGSVTIPELK